MLFSASYGVTAQKKLRHLFLLETYWSCHCHLQSLKQPHVAHSHCLNMMDCLSGWPWFYIIMIPSSLIERLCCPSAFLLHRLKPFCAVNYSEQCKVSLHQTFISLIILLYVEIQPCVACKLACAPLGVVYYVLCVTDCSDVFFLLDDDVT